MFLWFRGFNNRKALQRKKRYIGKLGQIINNYKIGQSKSNLPFFLKIVHMDTLKLLLHQNIKRQAIQGGTFEKLVDLLNRNDEQVLCRALSCLGILCEDLCGKQRAAEMDVLKILKTFLQDDVIIYFFNTNSRVKMFSTKMRAFLLESSCKYAN